MNPGYLQKEFKKETGILIRGEHMNFQKEVWDYIDWLEKKLTQSTQMINSVQEENKVLQSENQQFQDMIEKGLTFEDLKNDSE